MAASRRARAVAQARQAAEDQAFLRRCKALVRMLRTQAGIPVRAPAHQVAPFRAIPINAWGMFQVVVTATGWQRAVCPVLWQPAKVAGNAGSSVTTVDSGYGSANGTSADMDPLGSPTQYSLRDVPQFPDGLLGFVTGASCWAWPIANDATTVGANSADLYKEVVQNMARWSWIIDGQSVPGYHGAMPTIGAEIAEVSSATNKIVPGAYQMTERLGCPVQIRPGQRSHIEGAAYKLAKFSEFNIQWAFAWRLTGYAIPTKNGADQTIYDTLTD